MSYWQPIADAPRDNTSVIVKTSSGSVFAASWYDYTGEGAQWGADEEGLHPDCWTDGLCWYRNEDDEPSDQPIAFVPNTAVPSYFPAPEIKEPQA